MSRNPLGLPGHLGNSLGDYLREQRLTKKLSVRQLSALAGISNPYLSQIERGVKRPSADILQQIAKGLSISAETLYVQAGLLDPQETPPAVGEATRAAIIADPALTLRQRQTLLDIYTSFVEDGTEETPTGTATTAPATKTATKKAPAKKTAAKKTAATKAPAKKTAAKKAPAKKTAAKKAPAKKTAATKATPTKTTAATQTSAASKKGSSSTSSKNTSASGAARGTTTSSSTSTPRRNA